MNKQKKIGIGWCDYTWSPVTGCLNNCWYCYAAKIGKRFQGHFKPTFHPERLKQPYKLKTPSKIFVCSMADLFGKWMSSDVIEKVIQVARDNPQHTFQFLTKNPWRYRNFDFPENCWTGETLTGIAGEQWSSNFNINSFISYEPLLGRVDTIAMTNYSWLIIGALTGAGSKEHQPKLEWIEAIVEKARKYKIPVFMKRSLQGIWKGKLIREFPKKENNSEQGKLWGRG